MKSVTKRTPAQGLATDSQGGPVVDPTENVKALTEAANLRQDDLREASDKFNLSQIDHVKEIQDLHMQYKQLLSIAEAKRIDAIRAVDVNAVAIASERATQQAAVLADSVTRSADTLRNLVASTATNIAEQLKQIVDQFNTRISAVERSQYEGQGKGSVTDPQMAILVEEVRKLNSVANQNTGRGGGLKDAWALIVAGIAIIFSLLQYFKA